MTRRPRGPRVVRDCACPRASHVHGTPAAYNADGCRCDPCTDAVADVKRARGRSRAYGRPSAEAPVPAGPVRSHLLALLESMTLKQVEERSGVAKDTLRKLSGPDSPARVRRSVSSAILSVAPEQGRRVPSLATVRRLRALVARGFSPVFVTGQIGVFGSTARNLLDGVTVTVTPRMRDDAHRLYERLWNAEVPEDSPRQRQVAARSRNRARAAGWPVPAALDDDRIDDPDYRPRRYDRVA